jgi:hypothetical protein
VIVDADGWTLTTSVAARVTPSVSATVSLAATATEAANWFDAAGDAPACPRNIEYVPALADRLVTAMVESTALDPDGTVYTADVDEAVGLICPRILYV